MLKYDSLNSVCSSWVSKGFFFDTHSCMLVFLKQASASYVPNSDDREKLDGFKLFNSGSSQDAKNAANYTNFNVRNSLAWDSAFFTSPGLLYEMQTYLYLQIIL